VWRCASVLVVLRNDLDLTSDNYDVLCHIIKDMLPISLDQSE